MALNPILTPSGEVIRMPGEFLILVRASCHFDILVDNFKQLTGYGNVVVTSFRLVLVNLDPSTKHLWKGLDLPYPQIYTEKFTHCAFTSDQFKGSCVPVPDMLPGTIYFLVRTKIGGNLKRVEHAYKELVAMLRTQQFSKQINYTFQGALATCMFQKQMVLSANKDDPSYVYTTQPGYYAKDHYLIALMETALPGVTAYGVSVGYPEPDVSKGLASEFIPLEQNYIGSVVPIPVQPVPPVQLIAPPQLYPSLDVLPEEYMEKQQMKNCVYCKKECGEYGVITMKCSHIIHDVCGLKYVNELMELGKTWFDAVCPECSEQIEHGILMQIDEVAAGELFIRADRIVS